MKPNIYKIFKFPNKQNYIQIVNYIIYIQLFLINETDFNIIYLNNNKR